MRTTLTIHDELMQRARQESLARGCSVSAVVEDSLRRVLIAKQGPSNPTQSLSLKTFPGTGLQPGIDLSSTASLLETMEQ